MFGCPGVEPTPEPEPEVRTAQLDDWVVVDYTLKLEDGSIVETTHGKSPIRFQLLNNGEMIPGFIEGIVGMKEKEEKTVVVTPETGYGPHDPSKVEEVSRTYNKPLYENVSISYLESQGLNVSMGNTWRTEIGFIGIVNMTNETAELFYVLPLGYEFVFNGIPQKVQKVENDTAIIELNVQEGQVLTTTDEFGNPEQLVVMSVNETTVTWDSNHPMAGKTLYFDVLLRTIE